MQQHGTSYYIANMFFPKELREKVFTLYAFVRVPDDLVDKPWLDVVRAKKQLQMMRKVFQHAYEWTNQWWEQDQQRHHIAHKTAVLFHAHDIPLKRAEVFFAAMHADLEKKVYRTYEELQQYMHGSAEVVGLMMCKLIGYDPEQEQEVFRTAKLLWEAMQYTNFLRDIVEDSLEFDRLYIPEDRLVAHNLNHVLLQQYILGKPADATRETFMANQIMTCKELYREANTWIALLDDQWRKAVRIASWMYESILDKIIRNHYDVFSKDAHTTKREKMFTLATKSRVYALRKITYHF